MRFDKERCKRALNGVTLIIWEWNLKNNNIVFSDKLIDLVGENGTKFKSLYKCIEQFVIEDDKLGALKELDSYIKGKSKIYRSEFRIYNKDNEIKWVLIKGNGIKNSHGKIELISGSINDITERKKLEKEIKFLTYYDSLTKIPNRTLFIDNIKKVLENYKECRKNGALILLDIDDFTLVNDTFGYNYGDLFLIKFSQLLTRRIGTYGRVYRLSGDEFIILIDDIGTVDDLRNFCIKIVDYFKQPIKVKEKQIFITVSLGVSMFPKDSMDINDLCKNTNLAMYNSKLNGKNMVSFFEKSIADSYFRKLLIEQELKTAIKNNELYILYQPQIDTIENRVIGFEALLRWKNRKLGNVSPTEFIHIAEKAGSIIEIGEWVLKRVCKKIYELKSKGYKFETISVNVSPIQLKRDDFINKLISIYKKNKISPCTLEIEITEGTLIDLYSDKVEILNQIMESGIRVAIDDFGTGYSSLRYLTELSINTLKLDKSFIDNIDKEKNKAVIDCIMNLSRNLKYKVIAEGVEDKFQMDILEELGCNVIQGYYFSKPISEDKIEELLSKQSYDWDNRIN